MRPEKKWMQAEYAARISRAESIAVTKYAGLNADAINDLRRELEKLEVDYLVVKNRVFKRVLEDSSFQPLAEYCSEQTAFAMGGEDISAALKVMLKMAKDSGSPEVPAVMWGQDLFSGDGVTRLATLPSREELLGKVVGGIQAPLSGFVGVLNQLLSGLVITLSRISEKKA